MLSVSEAVDAILAETHRLAPVSLPLGEALGLVLAEDVRCELDSPPFDKALMDGFAVRSEDVTTGRACLRVIEDVMAGQVPIRRVESGEATRIMTGAPLPEGADAVVQVEHTRAADNASILIETTPVQPGRSILRRGAAAKAGQRLLGAGRLLRAQELGALAELGQGVIGVTPRPRVAVLATGDELVPIGERPGPGQIRNSNETMLVAQLRQAGAEPVPLGIARDERSRLRARIVEGLQCDLLLLSGGVSAGQLDLVPSELAAAGVRQVFHKVRVKPGQPVWFGVYPGSSTAGTAAERRPCYVFGLPGNPVSSMVCFELFARTAIRRLMGVEPAEPRPVRARLLCDFASHGDRPTYHPARFESTAEGSVVQPVTWIGSSDLIATVEANAMLLLPPGEHAYQAGEMQDVFPW